MPTKRNSHQPIDASFITERFVRSIVKRLTKNNRVRRTLPGAGRVHIDRHLPFLCLYREPSDRADDETQRLLTSEASYIITSDTPDALAGLRLLVHEIIRATVAQFGACLLLEIWTSSPTDDHSSETMTPGFSICIPDDDPGPIVETLAFALGKIAIQQSRPTITESLSSPCCPSGLPPIVSGEEAVDLGCDRLGLEISPVFRDANSGVVFPIVLQQLERGLTRSLRKTFYEYTRTKTTQRPEHFHVMGRRAVVKAVWEVDRQLAEVADAFDFLLQVTPINGSEAWQEFKRKKFKKPPVLHYRPLPVDPAVLKRKLFKTPIERIEDPALARVFRQKQDEMARKLTLLVDVNTPRFIHGSMQLFGDLEPSLVEMAKELLASLPRQSRRSNRSGSIDANAFAEIARQEIATYHREDLEFTPTIQIRGDITSGLMVSQGSLLIDEQLSIRSDRADALLQHEVGTHLLTYINGRAQPFRQLYSGLAGYEALQEGLAVADEFLVGGLSASRLRTLAARVVAANKMVEGATFIETYRELHDDHDFGARSAFNITLRLFRGGGFTKDIVYLRGLSQLLEYLRSGGDIEPLFIGKFALEHMPIIQELRWREVLYPPPLMPSYLQRAEVQLRIQKLRDGLSVTELTGENEE